MSLKKQFEAKADREISKLPAAVRASAIKAGQRVAALGPALQYPTCFATNKERMRFVVWCAIGCPMETKAVAMIIDQICNEVQPGA